MRDYVAFIRNLEEARKLGHFSYTWKHGKNPKGDQTIEITLLFNQLKTTPEQIDLVIESIQCRYSLMDLRFIETSGWDKVCLVTTPYERNQI